MGNSRRWPGAFLEERWVEFGGVTKELGNNILVCVREKKKELVEAEKKAGR